MPNSAVESILQAMIANASAAHAKAQLDQQKVRDTEEQRSNKVKEQYNQDALKQAMDIAQKNHEHAIAQEDIQHEANKLHAKSLHLSSVQQMREDISKGLVQPEATKQQIDFPDLGISVPQGSYIADGEAIPASQFQTPQGRIKQIEDESTARYKGEMALKGPEEEARQKLQDRKDQEAYKKAIDLEKLRGNFALRAAALRQSVAHGVDPDLVQSLMEQGTTGQTDLSKGTSPAILAARAAAQQSGKKLFGPKDAESLKLLSTLNDQFDNLKEFSNKYLYDSKLGAMAGGVINKTFPTDAADKLDQLKTNILNTGKALEGVTGGRVTNRQLELLMKGMASVGKTKSQGIGDAENLRNRYNKVVNDVVLAGVSPDQRASILNSNGINESKISGFKQPSGKIVYTRDSQGRLVQTNE